MSRAGHPEAAAFAGHRPLYARALRLRFLTPSGFLCFVFLEGAIALGILLALAELVSWWGVLVLPATVAIMVKLNDVIAGSLTAPVPAGLAPSSGLGAVARAAGGPAEHSSSLRPARVREAAANGWPSAGTARRGAAEGWSSAKVAGQPATDGWSSAGVADQAFAEGWSSAGVAREAAADGWPSARLADDVTTRLPAVIDGVGGVPIKRPWAEQADAQQQWIRQSATRRYE